MSKHDQQHKLLNRQVRKAKISEPLTEEVKKVLELVNQTYHETDQYIGRLNHAMSLSSKEMTILQKEIQSKNEILSQKVQDSESEIDYQKSVFNSVSKSIPVGIFIVNREGEYTYVNDSALKIVHEEREELVGKKWFDYCQSVGIQISDHSKIVDSLSGDEPNVFKLTHIPEKVVKMTCLRISDGGIVGCVEDITKIEVFKAKTKEAVAKSEEANRAKSFFLANMSHEIRTPLNGILGLSTLLKSEGLTEEQMIKVKSIEESGKHLMHLINDILDLSKIEAGALELNMNSYSPRQIIDSVLRLLEEKAQEKGNRMSIRYSGEIPEYVKTDDLRFKQIVLNLLGNAIKFTDAGDISIFVSYQNDHIHLQISDSGIGMSEDQVGKLFSRFYQADNASTRNFEGTGLGLAITKNLIELFEGEISCSSTKGKGTTFKLDFKAEKILEPIKTEASEEGDTLNLGEKIKLRILVAEDNKVNQMVINAFLNNLGYQPKIVNDGKEAIDELDSQDYDLVFMDIQMPRMSGLDAIKYIRHSDKLKKIKVFALTAGAMEQEREKILKAGADEYLTKPIEPEKIRRVIIEHFNGKD